MFQENCINNIAVEFRKHNLEISLSAQLPIIEINYYTGPPRPDSIDIYESQNNSKTARFGYREVNTLYYYFSKYIEMAYWTNAHFIEKKIDFNCPNLIEFTEQPG